jgi:hypothetical protein
MNPTLHPWCAPVNGIVVCGDAGRSYICLEDQEAHLETAAGGMPAGRVIY